MPIILPPPQKKTKHLSDAAWIAAAQHPSTGVTWAQARAGIIANGTPPRDADIKIKTATAPAVVKQKLPSQSTITKTLSPASTPADQSAAIAKLVQTGQYKPDEAAYIVHQSVTPTPDVPSLDWILKSLQLGTLGRDEARVYFSQLGVPPSLEAKYLATAKAQFDKWAVMGADGKIKFTPITSESTPPKNVLHYGPTPLTETQYTQVWTQNYKDQFFSYTGRQASGKEVAAILKQAPSIFTLQTELANAPTFTKSPIYKQHAAGVIQTAKSVLGQGWKPSTQLIAKAISQNWSQSDIYAHVRALPAYLQGPEFKDGSVKKAAVFSQIYGTPSQTDLHTIGQAQLAGWTDDQFAAYLRAQPNYTKSPEYVSKLLSFGQQLGLITGMQPTLQPGGTTPKNPNQPVAQQVPDSKRLPAPGPVKSPIDYSVTGV